MTSPLELGFKESRVKPLLFFKYYGAKGIMYIDTNKNPPNIYIVKGTTIDATSDLARSVAKSLSEGVDESRRRIVRLRLNRELIALSRRLEAFYRLPKEEQKAIRLKERVLFDNFKNCNRCEEDSTIQV